MSFITAFRSLMFIHSSQTNQYPGWLSVVDGDVDIRRDSGRMVCSFGVVLPYLYYVLA